MSPILAVALAAEKEIVMSYENLMRFQSAAELVASLLALLGLLILVAGLIRPNWVRLAKRRWVAATALVLFIAATGIYGGATFFTHSQPNGPHSFGAYMDGLTAKMCIRQPEHQDCKDLAEKCARRDPTHPPCRILAGEDPRKFYSNSEQRRGK